MKFNITTSTLLLLFFLFSCGDEEPRYTVPRSSVFFFIDLSSADDRALQPGGGTKTYPFPGNRISADRGTGFGGLLVVNSGVITEQGLPLLYAYDLACPKEDSRRSLIVPQTGGVSAICPTCKSEYSIILGTGHVMSGPSEESLQRYRVAPTDPYGGYRIFN